MEKPIEIPITLGGIGGIKKELKELKGLIASSTDPEQLVEYTKRAGELQDKLRDVNEQVAIFAGGSGFEKISNNLGDIQGKLFSLDFTGAADSALLLTKNISMLNPEEITAQVKGLTDTFMLLGKAGGSAIMGLIKNVGTMAKSFFSFGLSLLTNPIFILATAIVAIVTVIGLLLDKLGFLKPILDGIGKVFGWLGDIIDAIVQSFKDVLDLLGLTDYAGEENAKKEAERLDKALAKYKEQHATKMMQLDEEIKIRKAQGKDVDELERQKQAAITKTAQLEYDVLKAKLNSSKYIKNLSEEEIKALKDQFKEAKSTLIQAKSDFRVLEAEQKADAEKKAEEANKEAAAKRKEAAAKQKQYAADRLAAQRQLMDLEIANMEEGIQKEIKANEIKYDRLIEDTNKNEKLKAEEKKKIVAQLELQEIEELDKIRNANNEKILAEIQEQQEAERLLMEQNDANALDRKKRDMAALLELETTSLEERKSILDQQRDLELQNKELLESEKMLIEQKYAEQKAALDQQEVERKKQVEAQKVGLVQDGLSVISELTELFGKGNEAAARKAFNVNKAVAIAQTVISTFQAAQAAYASQLTVPDPSAPVRGAIAAGIAIASGLAKVAKISQTKFNGGASAASGGGASAGSAPAGGSGQQPAQPQVNLFGQGNNANTVTAGQPVQGQQTPVFKTYVSETDMTRTQKRVGKFEQNASL